MGLTNISGPLVVASSDQDVGPSVAYGGAFMLLDPRVGYQAGGAAGSPPVVGWGSVEYMTVKQAPSTAATNNIVNAQTGTANTGLTLVSASGAGITVGVSVAGKTVLAIDGAQVPIGYGRPAAVASYDPRLMIARALRYVSGTAGDTTQTLTTRGFDVYNQPMSEVITLNGTTPVSGKKAFKYILSITPSANTGAISVGTLDIFGLPLLAAGTSVAIAFPPITIYWAGVNITAVVGFTIADATSPATGTTGDVRGTYAVQSASDGTKELYISQYVMPWNIGPTAGLPPATAYQGLFGVPQFTN